MAANANISEEVSPLDQAASNLVRAYTEKRSGAADAAINFYATLQEKGMSAAELVNYRELGFIAITEANKAHLPGAQDAAATLNAAILDDPRVNRKELPNYKELTDIANNIGFVEEFSTGVTGVVDGSKAFAKQVVNTPAAIVSGMQQGNSGIVSKESAAKVMTAAYELAQDPLAIVKQLYHKKKDDGGNLNMEERHARAALYRLPAEERVAALKAQTWQDELNADSMLVGGAAAKATPGALRETGAAFNALAAEASDSKLVGAGIGQVNGVEGLPAEQDVAKANVMAMRGYVKSPEIITEEDRLIKMDAAITTGAEADAAKARYAISTQLDEGLTATSSANVANHDPLWLNARSRLEMETLEAEWHRASPESDQVHVLARQILTKSEGLSSCAAREEALKTLPGSAYQELLLTKHKQFTIALLNREEALGYDRAAVLNAKSDYDPMRTNELRKLSRDPEYTKLEMQSDIIKNGIEPTQNLLQQREAKLLNPANITVTSADQADMMNRLRKSAATLYAEEYKATGVAPVARAAQFNQALDKLEQLLPTIQKDVNDITHAAEVDAVAARGSDLER